MELFTDIIIDLAAGTGVGTDSEGKLLFILLFQIIIFLNKHGVVPVLSLVNLHYVVKDDFMPTLTGAILVNINKFSLFNTFLFTIFYN